MRHRRVGSSKMQVVAIKACMVSCLSWTTSSLVTALRFQAVCLASLSAVRVSSREKLFRRLIPMLRAQSLFHCSTSHPLLLCHLKDMAGWSLSGVINSALKFSVIIDLGCGCSLDFLGKMCYFACCVTVSGCGIWGRLLVIFSSYDHLIHTHQHQIRRPASYLPDLLSSVNQEHKYKYNTETVASWHCTAATEWLLQ